MREDVVTVTIRFRLNPANPRDKVIIDFLDQEYSANETVKAILYKIATMGSCGQLASTLAQEMVTQPGNERQERSAKSNERQPTSSADVTTNAYKGQPKETKEIPTKDNGGQGLDEDILKFFK